MCPSHFKGIVLFSSTGTHFTDISTDKIAMDYKAKRALLKQQRSGILECPTVPADPSSDHPEVDVAPDIEDFCKEVLCAPVLPPSASSMTRQGLVCLSDMAMMAIAGW